MNKVVVRHNVPAASLPVEILGDISRDAIVTVTVKEADPTPRAADLIEALARYRRVRTGDGRTAEAAVEDVRALRDEWDD